jgi:hypothetical protein
VPLLVPLPELLPDPLPELLDPLPELLLDPPPELPLDPLPEPLPEPVSIAGPPSAGGMFVVPPMLLPQARVDASASQCDLARKDARKDRTAGFAHDALSDCLVMVDNSV